jgi:hypothetical protein
MNASALIPSRADIVAAKLGSDHRRRIASSLGVATLTNDKANAVVVAVAIYKKQQHGHRSTTIGSARVALRKVAKAIERAIATRRPLDRLKAEQLMDRIKQPNSGLPEGARAVLLNCGEEPTVVLAVAVAMDAELAKLQRINPKTEVLRYFLGLLRSFFDSWSAVKERRGGCAYRRRCRSFARAVLDAADINNGRLAYLGHPRRLDTLLATDVSPLPVPDADHRWVQKLYFRGGVPAKKMCTITSHRSPRGSRAFGDERDGEYQRISSS